VQIEPYLFFEGCCEEAIKFYCGVLGAEVTTLMRYGESPEPGACPPGAENKIRHANLRMGDARVSVSDGLNGGRPYFQGFSLILSLSSEAEAQRMFQALAEGGQIHMPLAKTFYSPLFGMVADRFGVSWMIMVTA
jgi:PhnB protein